MGKKFTEDATSRETQSVARRVTTFEFWEGCAKKPIMRVHSNVGDERLRGEIWVELSLKKGGGRIGFPVERCAKKPIMRAPSNVGDERLRGEVWVELSIKNGRG